VEGERGVRFKKLVIKHKKVNPWIFPGSPKDPSKKNLAKTPHHSLGFPTSVHPWLKLLLRIKANHGGNT